VGAGSGVVAVLVWHLRARIPALAIIGGDTLNGCLDLETHHQYWLAIVVLAVATIVIPRGVTWTGAVNTASLVALLVTVAYLTLSRLDYGLTGAAFVCRHDFQRRPAWNMPRCGLSVRFWSGLTWLGEPLVRVGGVSQSVQEHPLRLLGKFCRRR